MFVWLKNLIIKKAAKEVSEKLNLKEGPMEEGKSWYKSKGVITGITAVLLGTYEMVRLNLAPQFGWNVPEIPPVIFTFLGALGVYSRVTAGKVIK
jgi:hypothetical protein